MTFVSVVQLSFVIITFPQSDKMSVKTCREQCLNVPFKAGAHWLPVSRTHWNPPTFSKGPTFPSSSLSREKVHVALKQCAHHLFSSFSQVGMCWPCLCLWRLMKHLQGFPRLDKKTSEGRWKGSLFMGPQHKPQGNFLYLNAICWVLLFFFFGFWTKFWEEGEGPWCQSLIGWALPSHKKRKGDSLLSWNLLLLKYLHF